MVKYCKYINVKNNNVYLIKMWLDSEINRLGQLYSKTNDPGIDTVLPKDDLACIEELSSTELATLKNYLFVPKVKLS